MSTNVPASVWRRTSGNGELGTTDDSLTTLSGLQLTTLSGSFLVTLPGSYTPVPDSVWSTVETVPASVWHTRDGLTENVYDGPNDLVDTLGVFIVDTAGDQIVDTGIEMDIIPGSIWEEDDSL